MPNRKTRTIQLVRPHVAGKPLISLKKRPNDPCQCGSGKKQKKCHGMNTVFWSPRPEEAAKKLTEFIHVSLVETHKKDLFLTLVRSDMPGYTCFVDQAGRFESTAVDSETILPVQLEAAKTYMQPGESNGRKGMVLPNNMAVRRTLGITLTQLKGRKKTVSN